MRFDAETSLRLIRESLGLVDRLGAKPIAVRDVGLSDRTLVVAIDVATDDPIAIRGDIAGAMGALHGLGIPDLFPVLGVQSFGVRAFHIGSREELLWIVSSPEAAGFIAEGQPIEWLARSLVQENTPAYRRSQADRQIGQVETGLRDLIDLHASQRAPADYPADLWPDGVAEMRGQARAEGADPSDPRTLLDYAYLPQLRDALVGRAEWFSDGCLPDGARLHAELSALNRVRRKVAHHRAISPSDLRTCAEATRIILAGIGHVHPNLMGDFLVDRWEDEVQRIVEEMQRAFRVPEVPDAGAVPEPERRQAAVLALRTQHEAVASAMARLEQLVVPHARRELHETARAALSRWRGSLEALIEVADGPDLTLDAAQAAQARYEDALAEVGAINQRIRALRVTQR